MPFFNTVDTAFGIVQSAPRSGIRILDSREVVDTLNLAHKLPDIGPVHKQLIQYDSIPT